MRPGQWFSKAPALSDEASELARAKIEVVGNVLPASNLTLLCRLPSGQQCVYKPISGEQPLWDFPDGTLAFREHAAWLVSEALGWDLVPETVLREGPLGPGTIQRWIDTEPTRAPVSIVSSPPDLTERLQVMEAVDISGRSVSLVHDDHPVLWSLAVFDLVVNNADRKGGHVLAARMGDYNGIDHGLCFHVDDKLRTVLWGWGGLPIPQNLLIDLEALEEALALGLGDKLRRVLAEKEVVALAERVRGILDDPHMPEFSGGWRSLPWPPL